MTRSTRDYAHKAKPRTAKRKSKRQHKKSAPLGLWLVSSVLIAVFVGGLVYLKQHEQSITQTVRVAKQKAAKKLAQKPEQPRFEFYNVLPNMQVNVDHTEAPSQPSGQYILQVASVKNVNDADRLKAQLTLLGFDVHISEFKTKTGTFNRVSLGPYDNVGKAESARERLAKNQYQSIIRRVN